MCQIGPAQIGSSQLRAYQAGPCQIGPAQIQARKIKPAQITLTQVERLTILRLPKELLYGFPGECGLSLVHGLAFCPLANALTF
jgi:hypothetical protein